MISGYLRKAAAAIILFFGEQDWATDLATMLTKMANAMDKGKGIIPKLKIGTWSIGPIPISDDTQEPSIELLPK